MKIGLISDTHGRLDSRVVEAFAGVDRILHAGDVGGPEILTELSAVAPVTAVAGNTDGFSLAGQLRAWEALVLGGVRFLLIHQVGRPEKPGPGIRRLIDGQRPEVLVFGHTHAPFDRVIEGVRFFNPGGAGPPRFRLPRTVALMEVSSTGIHPRHLLLEADRPDPEGRRH